MITTLVRRVIPIAGVGVVLASIILNQPTPPAHADVWMHLRMGREFLSTWSLRHPGHLGVYDSAPWLPTQWLPQEGMAWTEEHFGVAGLVWATTALAMLVAVLVYVSCRSEAPPLPAAIAAALGLMAAAPGLAARPQLFSYLLIVLTTWAWLATARDGKLRFWIVGLAWLWPMLHGMWLVGVSISVVAVIGLVLQRDLPRSTLVRASAIPALSCAVAVLNPLGFGVWRSILDVGSRSTYFTEWGPPDFTAPAAAVLAVMLAIVIGAGMRSEPVSWVHTALTVLALGWGLYSLRTTPVAALILAPLLSASLRRLTPEVGLMQRAERSSLTAMLVLALLAAALVTNHRVSDEGVVPSWVDSRLDALPAGTRVLNDWDTGSYFLFRHPDLDLVMHGYGDVFTDRELMRNVDLVRLRPGWSELVTELDAEVALVDPDTPLGAALEVQLGWTRIEGDDEFVLLAPPGGS